MNVRLLTTTNFDLAAMACDGKCQESWLRRSKIVETLNAVRYIARKCLEK